jgi:threonine dehydratase
LTDDSPIGFADVEAARDRIAPIIRQTPMMEATNLREPPADVRLFLKLEHLQASGSFKARGAMNKLLTTPKTQLRGGIVTASGGNHGVATARAARIAGVPATVFVPATVSADKVAKLEAWGATVRLVGNVWDQSNVAALAFADQEGAAYFHPFGDPAVIAGQGTVGLEIASALPDVDTLLVAIGGGGLVSGLCVALRALKPGLRIVGVEPVGAPTLKASMEAGRVVTLPSVTTRVATMGCGRTVDRVFEIVRHDVDEIVLVSDQEMVEAARWLWFELGIAADLSGAASIAALRRGRVAVKPGSRVCALICGSGTEWMTDA